METLVFETALGHVALARESSAMECLAAESGTAPFNSMSAESTLVESTLVDRRTLPSYGGDSAIAKGQSGRLLALSFGHPNQRAAFKALSSMLSVSPNCLAESDSVYRSSVYAGGDDLVHRLTSFARGEVHGVHGEVDAFGDWDIDTSHLTPFGRKVIAACRQIGWGETLTYGELARRAGRPGAARAVGSVMARNRVPLIVPCHRVVPASGGLGGFSAPQGVAMKRRLLALEQSAILQTC